MGRQEVHHQQPAYIDNTHYSQRPRIEVEPPESNTIEQQPFDEVFFIDYESVILYPTADDPRRPWVTICTANDLPADQSGNKQYGVMKILSTQPNGSLEVEYVLDVRSAPPNYYAAEFDESIHDRDGRKPVRPLAIALASGINDDSYIIEGVEHGRDAVLQLTAQVDELLRLSEVQPTVVDDSLQRKIGAFAGKILDFSMPLFKSLVADEVVSHEIVNAFVQHVKHGSARY
jgi:hypothetical protein